MIIMTRNMFASVLPIRKKIKINKYLYTFYSEYKLSMLKVKKKYVHNKG